MDFGSVHGLLAKRLIPDTWSMSHFQKPALRLQIPNFEPYGPVLGSTALGSNFSPIDH